MSMTDEEIKRGLEELASISNWGGVERIDGVPKPIAILTKALELINKLEKSDASKERYTIELYNRAREAEREVKEWKQKFLDFDKFGNMTTPIGLLPINTDGMRQLVDAYASTLNELNHYKEENKDLYDKSCNLDSYISNHEEIWKANSKIAEDVTRKQVAKDILQAWYADVVHGMGEDGSYVRDYAKQYGVVLDD